MATFTPFFQLQSRANVTPWTVPDHVDETVALYRYHAKLHDALVPFFYSLAEEAWAKGTSILHPVGEEAQWAKNYRFVVGDAFLVAPILDASGKRDVVLPSGARWYDWWANDADAIEGGTTLAAYDATDRKKIPVFVREGAIVPLAVVDDANGLGTKASSGAMTVLIWPAVTPTSFTRHDEDGMLTTIAASAENVTLSRAPAPQILRIRATASTVALGGTLLTAYPTRASFDTAAQGAFIESSSRSIWVKLASGPGPLLVTWK